MVLAIIGLLTTVTLTGVNRMLNPGPDTPQQAFWKMMAAARHYALLNECEVRLLQDGATGELEAYAVDGTELPPAKLPDGITLSFMPVLTSDSISSASGTLATATNSLLLSTDGSLNYITFRNDGTCTPAQVEFKGMNTSDGNAPTMGIDPWTGGPLLNPGTANGG